MRAPSVNGGKHGPPLFQAIRAIWRGAVKISQLKGLRSRTVAWSHLSRFRIASADPDSE
jgi:hypothetical protein